MNSVYACIAMSRPQDTPFPKLCEFQFADGRHCALPTVSSSGYCRSHGDALRYKPPVEEDLYGIMMSVTTESGINMTEALEKVWMSLAGNRISTRRAATFGYLAQLILLSRPQAAETPQTAGKSQLSAKPNSSRPSNGKTIDEATLQALLAKLREKFPQRSERPPIPPGRNHNQRP